MNSGEFPKYLRCPVCFDGRSSILVLLLYWYGTRKDPQNYGLLNFYEKNGEKLSQIFEQHLQCVATSPTSPPLHVAQ